ncbi:MAG: hypothetical protein K2M46_03630 [Lachnospiraceae bacterium]|nr:hypothetical protein [Lachnospiraceae bacterium]
MGVDSVSTTQAAAAYETSAAKTEEKKTTETETAKTETAKTEQAAVYEQSDKTSDKKATYSINKMSEKDRAALVKQLKADQENRQQSLINIVQNMMSKQGTAFGIANSDKDSVWKFLASGKYTVDAATKAQAQEDISEDGYWGVKQTSQRLFDFASALAGDDEKMMQKMQKAIEKGYKQATKAWGKELPSICKSTIDATNKLFDDYYASKKTTTDTTQTAE